MNLPYFNLDSLVYLKGWNYKHTDNQIKKSIEIIANKDKWVLEGFHSKKETWMLPSLEKADFVVILNLSNKVLFKNNLKRAIDAPFSMYGFMYVGDLIWKSSRYKSKVLPKDIELVRKYRKTHIILNTESDVKDFVNKITIVNDTLN